MSRLETRIFLAVSDSVDHGIVVSDMTARAPLLGCRAYLG